MEVIKIRCSTLKLLLIFVLDNLQDQSYLLVQANRFTVVGTWSNDIPQILRVRKFRLLIVPDIVMSVVKEHVIPIVL